MIAEVLPGRTATQLDSSADSLVIVTEFPTHSPDALFDYWTVPELLCRWWPQQATTERAVGGAYHLAWPSIERHLRGRYTAYRPGRNLSFSWQWDHEITSAPVRWVEVIFRALPGGGTRLTVIHDPFGGDEEEQQARADHLEGWQHFIERLRALQQ